MYFSVRLWRGELRNKCLKQFQLIARLWLQLEFKQHMEIRAFLMGPWCISLRALKLGYLTQDMIDDYEPGLMFTIPRLAIVW